MFTMISRRIQRLTIAGASAVFLLIWWSGRDRPPPTEPEVEPSASPVIQPDLDSMPIPDEMSAATLNVPATWMLSRSMYIAPPVTSATNGATPGRSGEPNAFNRILSPYAHPLTMMSPAATNLAFTRPQAVETPAPIMAADPSAPTNLIAVSYVDKLAMLSQPPENMGALWVTYTQPINSTNLMAKVPVIALAKRDDPDAMAKATYYLREAEANIHAGIIDKATTYYSLALSLFPRMAYANKQFGRLALIRGDFALAAHHLAAALESDDTPGETLNDLGIAYLYSGKTEQAIEAFKAATSASPELLEPYFNTGLALRQAGRVEDAQNMFRHYMTVAPNDARVYRELAVIDALQENQDAALRQLDQAMALDPTWYTPRFDAAFIYAERKDVARTLEQMDRALDYAPAWVVFQIYSQPLFHDIRLMPESRPFESRLAAAARKGILP